VQATIAARSSAARTPSGATVGSLIAFVAALSAAGVLLAAGTMMVPVRAALLPQAERFRYMDAAIAAASLVVVVVSIYVYAVRRWGRRFAVAGSASPAGDVQRFTGESAAAPHPTRWLAPLAVLRPEIVPTRIIVITAVVALSMVGAAWLMVFPPWAVVSAAVVPWMPVFFAEGLRKYRHYGLYAVFGAITLLQIGHLGEHTVQVIQVFLFNGDLSRAHGVFGQLDFETVHFVWDSLVWIGLGVLVMRYGRSNLWLWVSLFFASLHEIEHLYLFFVYRMDPTFYTDGGFAGIMGFGGLVGSPLARPYLHFGYNVCVIVPLIFAFWYQTVQVHRKEKLER
jgi:hypothetical protein